MTRRMLESPGESTQGKGGKVIPAFRVHHKPLLLKVCRSAGCQLPRKSSLIACYRTTSDQGAAPAHQEYTIYYYYVCNSSPRNVLLCDKELALHSMASFGGFIRTTETAAIA